jgi:hypothetical protein
LFSFIILILLYNLVHKLKITRLPGFVEPRFQQAIEAQYGKVAFSGDRASGPNQTVYEPSWLGLTDGILLSRPADFWSVSTLSGVSRNSGTSAAYFGF